MEEKEFNSNKLIRLFLVLSFVLSVICMTAMMYYASVKVVVVSAEEAENQAEETEKQSNSGQRSFRLNVKSTTKDGYFAIPCLLDGESDRVQISERPDLNTVNLVFNGVKNEYLSTYAPHGDFSEVSEIYETISEDTVTISIETKKACYAKVEPKDREIVISLEEIDPSETVVCVDASYGGAHTGTVVGNVSEKDITLALAKTVKKLAEGKKYRIVLTRDSDSTMTIEERLTVMEKIGADYYLGLALDTNIDDRNAYGMKALYNGEMFRAGFENVDFADEILSYAATAGKTRANSLNKADKNNVILMALDIPGVTLMAGTITNEAEAQLLTNETYMEMIAEGIIEALDSVVEQ